MLQAGRATKSLDRDGDREPEDELGNSAKELEAELDVTAKLRELDADMDRDRDGEQENELGKTELDNSTSGEAANKEHMIPRELDNGWTPIWK